jgi:hypothetical protein
MSFGLHLDAIAQAPMTIAVAMTPDATKAEANIVCRNREGSQTVMIDAASLDEQSMLTAGER